MRHTFTSKSLSLLENLQDLPEDVSLEFKTAIGKDGKGDLPKDFFPTYSAMANTNGGIIALGIEQAQGSSRAGKVIGIADPAKVLKQLWDSLNNPERVSVNLLKDSSIQIHKFAEENIIFVSIPRASRKHRPVYINGNPYTGTFRRNHEGDYHCTKDEVARMISDSLDESSDSVLLPHYGIPDLDQDTLRAYRNNFKVNRPTHFYNDLDDKEFLERLGAWKHERETGQEGLTIAGLLMFGKCHIIQEVLPNYFLDYQERLDEKAETKWIDRLTIDGNWSGNLYDFYRKVIQKLYSDLKVQFKLRGSERVDDTPVHEALREALVNSLIHADYSGSSPILVVKRPDMFGFQNPGGMRVPLEDARRGVNSDCRNKKLQHMFFMVGSSDKAGTGIPRIYKNWEEQQWRPPVMVETVSPDETILQLPMVSLIPDAAIQELDRRFGASSRQKFSEIQVLALTTVINRGYITHSMLKKVSKEHPRDITLALAALVKDDSLISGGTRRGKYYYFKDLPPSFHDDKSIETASEVLEVDDEFLSLISSDVDAESIEAIEEILSSKVSLLPNKKDLLPDNEHILPDKVEELPDKLFTNNFLEIARPAREKDRIHPKIMEQLILQLCLDEWQTPKNLALWLERHSETLRKPIRKLLQEGYLEERFPGTTTNPKQAYKSTQIARDYLAL